MDCGGWSFLSHMFSRNSYILLAAAVLLAFFTVLGDALALLALQPSCPAAEDEVTPCPA